MASLIKIMTGKKHNDLEKRVVVLETKINDINEMKKDIREIKYLLMKGMK